MTILEPLRPLTGSELVDRLADIMTRADSGGLMTVYRLLDGLEEQLIPLVKTLKEASDQQIKKGLVKSYRQNSEFVRELAALIDSLQDDDEADEDEAFDEDAAEETEPQTTSAQKAAQVYIRLALRFSVSNDG